MRNQDLKILKELIEATVDSADGFNRAASETGDAHLAAVCMRRGLERRALAQWLKAEVEARGGSTEGRGSLLAAAHRQFMELRKALSSGDHAVLAEVIRGEGYVKAKYESALTGDELSLSAYDVVLRGFWMVQEGFSELSGLCLSGDFHRSASYGR